MICWKTLNRNGKYIWLVKTMSWKTALRKRDVFSALSLGPQYFPSDNFVGNLPVFLLHRKSCENGKTPPELHLVCIKKRNQSLHYIMAAWLPLCKHSQPLTSTCFNISKQVCCTFTCVRYGIGPMTHLANAQLWVLLMQTSCFCLNSKPRMLWEY